MHWHRPNHANDQTSWQKDSAATPLQGMQPRGPALRRPPKALNRNSNIYRRAEQANAHSGFTSFPILCPKTATAGRSFLIRAHRAGQTFRDSSCSSRHWRDTQKLTSWCNRALTTKTKGVFSAQEAHVGFLSPPCRGCWLHSCRGPKWVAQLLSQVQGLLWAPCSCSAYLACTEVSDLQQLY